MITCVIEVLKQQLKRLFKDPQLLALFAKIIASYEVSENRGLPIGNLTSQYFANHYLSAADWFVKQDLRVKHYMRYMDDMVLWSNDKDLLKHWRDQFARFITRRLRLALNPINLNATRAGVPFLGYVLFPHQIRLNKVSKKRFLTKVKCSEHHLKAKLWSPKDYQNHVVPLTAFTLWADSFGLRNKAFKNQTICG